VKILWWLQYAALRIGALMLHVLPLRLTQAVAGAVARRTTTMSRRHHREAMENLQIAFPDLDPAEHERIARESQVQLFWNGIDVARSQFWTPAQTSSRLGFEGREILDEALAEGKGVLILSLHIGCFELAVRGFGMTGVPFMVLSRPVENPFVQRYLIRSREQFGSEIVDRGNAARPMLRQLKRGGMVGVLNDRYVRGNSVFVPFFGVRAATSTGVATFAVRTGAVVLPGFMVRDGPDHHLIRILPRVEVPPTGDRAKDIEASTAAYNRALEAVIRQYPEQWMWRHRRFRHSPDLPPRASGGGR
jgi:KDO2-lipid IV(A) lauroyltransferase